MNQPAAIGKLDLASRGPASAPRKDPRVQLAPLGKTSTHLAAGISKAQSRADRTPPAASVAVSPSLVSGLGASVAAAAGQLAAASACRAILHADRAKGATDELEALHEHPDAVLAWEIIPLCAQLPLVWPH